MLLNYVVVFEQRPYLLKIQLNQWLSVEIFYSRFRNFVTNQIRQAKINYFARKLQQLKGDCKSTWKQINSIILPNRINKKYIMNKICENDITDVTKHDISNVLNSYFVNIGKRISESMNAGPYDHYQYLKGTVTMLIHYILLLYPLQMLRKYFSLLEISQVISIQSQLLF